MRRVLLDKGGSSWLRQRSQPSRWGSRRNSESWRTCGEIRLEIEKEAMGGGSKVAVGTRKSLDAGVKQLLKLAACRTEGSHRSGGKDRRTRFCTAWVYSRQTSCGASCT